MRFFRLLLLSLALATGAVVGEAAEKPKLFKTYWYGQPMEEIRRDPSAYKNGNLLLIDTRFMGAAAQVVFLPFDTRDELSSVILMQDWDPDQFERLKDGLSETFLPLFGMTGGDVFDYIDAGATALQAVAAKRRFESAALAAGQFRLFMVERSAVRDVENVRNADEAVANEEPNARLAVLDVSPGKILVVFHISGGEGGDALPIEDF